MLLWRSIIKTRSTTRRWNWTQQVFNLLFKEANLLKLRLQLDKHLGMSFKIVQWESLRADYLHERSHKLCEDQIIMPKGLQANLLQLKGKMISESVALVGSKGQDGILSSVQHLQTKEPHSVVGTSKLMIQMTLLTSLEICSLRYARFVVVIPLQDHRKD